ncbi:alanine racemase [Engelhardtia mirabilis]|uniref:alanine racemase n=1 Tax=Engelhardtia mirabilis TaxID=2528011 RepID=UPI003AF39720
MNVPRVWAEIDLAALEHNLRAIRARIGPAVELILVVKADAYGHGAVAIARRAAALGVIAFGVGTVEEALELGAAGIRGRMIVLGTIVDEEAEPALRGGVELGVHSADRVRMLSALAVKLGLTARVHLNVDTGMGRLGSGPARALELLEEIHASPGLELAGSMTHVASSRGADDPGTAAQLRSFDQYLGPARERGLLRGWTHVANSACIFTGLEPRFDAVRPGIAALGMLPAEMGVIPAGGGRLEALRPVLSLRSQVVFFKDVEPGTPIGYGGTWRATRRSRIATLPVGYNDGVPWRLGNRGRALIRGCEVPIVGRVSMDYTTIDITDAPGADVGDVVTLIGRDGERELSASCLADEAGTIPYEITCSIGRRVPRMIVEGDARPFAGRSASSADQDPSNADRSGAAAESTVAPGATP